MVTILVGGTPLDLLPAHLGSPCVECLVEDRDEITALARQRELEAHRLAEVLADRRIVVAGDLNAGTWNDPRRFLLDAGLTDVRRAVGWGPDFTRGAERTVARVDWILTGPGVRPVGTWVGEPGRSDHRPVVADLALWGAR